MKIYDITGIGANLTGSFSGSFKEIFTGTATTASYVQYSNVADKPTLISGSSQIADFGYATTGSNQFDGSQAITGSLTVTGQVIAQTLNVQQVTSSIVYSSGSNIFGNDLGNTQQFTGSVSVTGSLTVTTTGTELQVTSTGVNLGNISTDNHNVTGSLRVSGSMALNGALTGTSATFRVSADRNLATRFDTNIVLSAQSDTAAPESLRIYADTFRLFTATTAGGLTERFTVSNTGNVGIGATPSAWNANSRALQLSSFISLSQQNNGALNLMSYAIESTGNSFTYGDTGVFPTRLNMNPNDGVITFFNAGTGTAGNAITFTSRLTILANGDVGIGTTPDSKFEIRGSTSSPQFRISRSEQTNQGLTIQAGGGATALNSYDGTDTVFGSYTFNATKGTNTVTRMRIDGSGNVGIGVDSPGARLQVRGANEISTFFVAMNDGASGATFSRIANSYPFNRFLFQNGYIDVGVSYMTYPVSIEAQSGGGQLALTRSGAVAEFYMGGTTGGSTQLYVRSGGSGGVRLDAGSTGWVGDSDIRLKDIEKPIENAVESLSTLQTIYYSWKNSENKSLHLGLIAQEVEAVFPEIVSESSISNMKGVNYMELIPVLIKAIQELSAKVETLEDEIQTLKQQ
jgi:hypothetical protein